MGNKTLGEDKKENDKDHELLGGEDYSLEELEEDEANGLGGEYVFDAAVEGPPHPFWAEINIPENYNPV